MHRAVYNSAIPSLFLNTANRVPSSARLPWLLLFFLVLLAVSGSGFAADWSTPEQQLARKVAAVTGPGAVALSVENRSSLGRRDSEIVQNGLRSELEALGLRFVKTEQAAATVTISLSESSQSYVWVAEIRQGSESTAVMVSAPRPEGLSVARDSVPLNLNKIPLWTQDEPILDIAVLEENPTPAQIAVLDPERVSMYRMQGGKWQLQQALELSHSKPWPRDLRGRLIPGRDHLFDAYLPGVTCAASSTAPLTLICRDSDDPWPLTSGTANGNSASIFPSAGAQGAASLSVTPMKAFFAPTRNFFTGAVNPAIGKFTTVPKFYSAAAIPREKYTLWLFAAMDGTTHLIDGVSDQTTRMGWGSDLASLKTSCGAGWQVLATSAGDLTGDTVRAYEYPDRDAVAVSAPIDLPGPVTALWTESRNDTAIAVARNRETGSYEAFRLALGCSQ
jgi:hypothetical protein